MKTFLTMLLAAAIAVQAFAAEAWPPAGWIDISVPILGNGESAETETDATGAYRADFPWELPYKSNNIIPSIMAESDPLCGHPAVKYARMTVRIEDADSVPHRIPEDQVPPSDLLIVSLARARNVTGSTQSVAWQGAADTARVAEWFAANAEHWKTTTGKADGLKVLRYVRGIGATQGYVDYLAEFYHLNAPPSSE